MDEAKRRRLIETLFQQPEPQIVPIDQFFDGNDDIGSIGCNLMEHPGIDAFRTVFAQLAQRPDVAAIYPDLFTVALRGLADRAGERTKA